MRAQGLVGVHARRRWRRGPADVAPAPDLVNRDFTPSGPDQVWAADVTQFRTHEGWLHLAGVIDLWSRRVVGWAMSNSPNGELVTDALLMAFQRRRLDRRVVHHSDRGAAYTSLAFSQRVTELELDQSFGSTGDCYDNAAVRSLLGHTQTRARLDPRHDNLGSSRRPSIRALRLHRRLLQPESHPTPAGPSKSRRLRTTLSRLKPSVHETGTTPTGEDAHIGTSGAR